VAQRISWLQKAESQDQFLLRKMDVRTYPDVWLLGSDFTNGVQISVANPQQSEYNWATVESVKWKAYDGQMLEGLLYKPENYDPNQKYPLLFYYYELNSDNLHNYQAPKPSASIINPTEYASGGYLVFVPDIRYQPGKPAQGAYNSIMSAADYLLKNYPIDDKRMGLQGQSWGGYQSAMLITMTTRFAAAMAGAPVSNMISAYGGIRWGSGLNRQFQYESTQSRIGATIWQKPDLYVENSPLFHLPKVQTPLLIMANDKDGAVPWYQGIELYNGLRRLNKPCWMLNYNEDDHNLTKLANKYDLSIRMRQFFDHYLMNAPAPTWMTTGIPAIQKGKTLSYE
jgi:dipeptidyl aminopeptidase/acylaminoacyl peptidase